MDQRPKLTKDTLPQDFLDFYWYKQELVDFCRQEGLERQGGKAELAERIGTYLRTGNSEVSRKIKPKIMSKFDWHSDELSLNTIITDNYKNSQNVRRFFQEHVDGKFNFNVEFMNWMKASVGKTLGDAIVQWKVIVKRKRVDNSHKKIAPQFEYNTYLRDFFADNPGGDRELGIRLWKIKRSLRGNNVYSREDLKLVE